VLGSGTVAPLMLLTSKAPTVPLVLTVHVFPPSRESALVPRAPTTFCCQSPSKLLLLRNGTIQYCMPACNERKFEHGKGAEDAEWKMQSRNSGCKLREKRCR
jgi:hypothetical protein